MEVKAKKLTPSEYFIQTELGVIVAFKAKANGKDVTLSGKLVERNGDVATVTTKNGTNFKIKKEDVVWVRTGARWPRWVFDELKKK